MDDLFFNQFAEPVDLLFDGLQCGAPEGLVRQVDAGGAGSILGSGHGGGVEQLLVLGHQ